MNKIQSKNKSNLYLGDLGRLENLVADYIETDPDFRNKEDLNNTALHAAALRGCYYSNFNCNQIIAYFKELNGFI